MLTTSPLPLLTAVSIAVVKLVIIVEILSATESIAACCETVAPAWVAADLTRLEIIVLEDRLMVDAEELAAATESASAAYADLIPLSEVEEAPAPVSVAAVCETIVLT